MKTFQDAWDEVANAFARQGLADPRRRAGELLCDLLGCSFQTLYLEKERLLSDREIALCRTRAERHLLGEPLAYLSGRVEFYGCLLEVTPAVLIPRPETELLVDRVVQSLRLEGVEGGELWDICCGSGCMGIALKKALPTLSVSLSDVSSEALALAARNARANGVEVTLLEGDLLAPFSGRRAHYVVCNPPYVSEGEYASLDCSVKDYEPRLALVGGSTGVEFAARLAHDLPGHLHPRAKVWLEMGCGQGEALLELFSPEEWKTRKIEKDWAGHPRFLLLECGSCS